MKFNISIWLGLMNWVLGINSSAINYSHLSSSFVRMCQASVDFISHLYLLAILESYVNTTYVCISNSGFVFYWLLIEYSYQGSNSKYYKLSIKYRIRESSLHYIIFNNNNNYRLESTNDENIDDWRRRSSVYLFIYTVIHSFIRVESMLSEFIVYCKILCISLIHIKIFATQRRQSVLVIKCWELECTSSWI